MLHVIGLKWNKKPTATCRINNKFNLYTFWGGFFLEKKPSKITKKRGKCHLQFKIIFPCFFRQKQMPQILTNFFWHTEHSEQPALVFCISIILHKKYRFKSNLKFLLTKLSGPFELIFCVEKRIVCTKYDVSKCVVRSTNGARSFMKILLQLRNSHIRTSCAVQKPKRNMRQCKIHLASFVATFTTMSDAMG